MSDVNISTSWSSLPSSDTEYNTVLGAAGYDESDNRLFLSAQQVPGIARNVTTEYARGFRITSGYDGIVLHDAITEAEADLKTVKFTMSTAGSAYDLTDARCYVQFKNHYSVDIASWALQSQAEDDTLTTIASGGTIAAGAAVQIDFKNDYNAVRFIFTITYAGGATYTNLTDWATNTPNVVNGRLTPYVGCWIPASQSYEGGTTTVPNIPITGKTCAVQNDPSYGNQLMYFFDYDIQNPRNYIATMYNSRAHGYYGQYFSSLGGNKYYARLSLSNIESTIFDYCVANGFVHSSVQDAIDAFVNPVSSGLNTADISDYTGNMWQCRMIANVAAISPGPMATESEGGTEGDFDVTSDQISAPGIPTTYTQSYFGHIYLIDSGNLSAVASIINSNDFIDQFYTNFGDIAKCIVSISQFPISTYSGAGALGDISVGSKRIASSSLTPQARPLSRFATVDCGSVDLHLFWDSALDLNPYTKLNVYIPCVGMRPLDADVVMGHTLGLYYNVDFMTGNALAILTLDGDYYDQYSCTLATQYALNTEQWGPVYQGIMSTLSTAAIGVAVSGSGGAMAGALAGAATQSVAQKLQHDKAGTMGASMSLFSQMQPFVEILRPIQQLPRDYTKFNAYPSYMTAQLINLSGYVEVQDIRLDDIDCTDAERSELMSMLQSGVIL